MNYKQKLIILFFALVLVKTIMAYFITVPVAFSDDYSYAMMARSFHNEGNFFLHGQPFKHFPPLYPLLISPAYVFSNMNHVFFAIKIINAIISSLIIIPVWFLAKEFMPKKKAFWAVFISAILPLNLIISNYIMSEGLFYTLFIFMVFLTYKAITEEKSLWYGLSGLSIGLAYLTKASGIVLVVAFATISLYSMIKKKTIRLKENLMAAGMFMIVTLPWFLYMGKYFGFTINGILGWYGNEITLMTSNEHRILAFGTWIILYFTYLLIAGSIVFPLKITETINFKEEKKNIFWLITGISTLLFIIVAANHNLGPVKYETFFSWLTGRPIGRYVEMILPLIIIGGMMSSVRKIGRSVWIGMGTLLVFGAMLAFFPLFPINNISLSWLGAINYVTEVLFHSTAAKYTIVSVIVTAAALITALAVIYSLIEIKKMNLQRLLPFVIIFFIMNGIIGYGALYITAKNWQNNEQVKMGIWFNDNIGANKRVLIDMRDNGTYSHRDINGTYQLYPDGTFDTLYGFFMNADLRYGNVENNSGYDYIITKHKIMLPVIYETENDIKIYQLRGSFAS